MPIFLPPVPYKSPVSDKSGYLAPAWTAWFRDLFIRIGGTQALSNIELADIPASLDTRLTAVEGTTTTHETEITTLQGQVNDLGQGPVL